MASPLMGTVRKKQTIKVILSPINYLREEWSSNEGLYCISNMSKHNFGCEDIDKWKYVGNFEHIYLDLTGFKT